MRKRASTMSLPEDAVREEDHFGGKLRQAILVPFSPGSLRVYGKQRGKGSATHGAWVYEADNDIVLLQIPRQGGARAVGCRLAHPVAVQVPSSPAIPYGPHLAGYEHHLQQQDPLGTETSLCGILLKKHASKHHQPPTLCPGHSACVSITALAGTVVSSEADSRTGIFTHAAGMRDTPCSPCAGFDARLAP